MRADELIEAMARAMFKDDQVNRLDIAKAALAVARPIILEEAAKAAEGFPKTREWAPDSFYDTLRREVAEDIRRLK